MTGYRLTIEREMATSIPDFLRILPGAVAAGCRAGGCGDADCDAAEAQAADQSGAAGDEGAARHIAIRQSGRGIEIALTAQPTRDIGAMRLPGTRVQIALSGFTESDAARFLEAFDARYRRGGG